MIWLLMVFVGVVCAFLQAAIPPLAILGQAKVPLLVAVVLYYATSHGTGEASVAALVCGLFHDVLSLVPLGQTSLVFFLVALVAGQMRRLVIADRPLTVAVLGGISAMAAVFVGHALLSRSGVVDVGAGRVWLKAFGTALLGALASPLLFICVNKLDALVGNIQTTEVIEDVLE